MDSKERPKLELFGGQSIYDLGFRYKICEGVTVIASAVVGFSYPGHFRYTVVETGETFSGNTGDAKEDYMKWKARETFMTSRPDQKVNSHSAQQTLSTETKPVQALSNTRTALPPLEELIGIVPPRQEEPMEIP